METFIKDIRFGIRSLLKRRGFTAIAVLTLALGMGACTAIFSVVDGVLLRSLPYPDAERIVQLREVNPGGVLIPFAEPNFLDVRARTHTLEAVAQYGGELTIVTGGSEPVRTLALAVSSDFFHVLGTKPILGRTFVPEESKPGGAPGSVDSAEVRVGLSLKGCQIVAGGRSIAETTGRQVKRTSTLGRVRENRWHPAGVRENNMRLSGGLRSVATTGYFLLTLRVKPHGWAAATSS